MPHKVVVDEKAIDSILDRGTVESIFPSKEAFRSKLLSGERLRFYWGFDATAPTLHLSHAKNFMLLEKIRKLGHEVIVLFGDFTARIGDPSDRLSARSQLSAEQALENVKAWRELISPLMDFDDPDNPPRILGNNEWLSKLSLQEFFKIASQFTVQQLIERDMFQKRIEANKPLFLHEFLYPVLQGFDSVAMDVDVECCGTDQIFNALAGRDLQRRMNQKEKFVLAVTLMPNPMTGSLMSKSNGTGIFLNETANDLFGQVMAQPDEMIRPLFVHNTLLDLDEIEQVLSAPNPRDAKLRLAYEITSLLKGQGKAKGAQEHFERVIRQKNSPKEVSEFFSNGAEVELIDALLLTKLVTSKGEARRLLAQDGIRVEGKTVKENEVLHLPPEGLLLQRGKRAFARLISKQ